MTVQSKTWLHGLGAAVVVAFTTAASDILSVHSVFNLSHDGVRNIAKITLVPTMLAVFAYLRKSPLPSNILQAGDTATLNNPAIAPDGTITGTSATIEKGPKP